MAEDRKQANEGEGNKTAAAEYNRGATEHARSGDVEREAREAADALDGPQGDELRQADEQGRSRAKEEDPALRGDAGKTEG